MGQISIIYEYAYLIVLIFGIRQLTKCVSTLRRRENILRFETNLRLESSGILKKCPHPAFFFSIFIDLFFIYFSKNDPSTVPVVTDNKLVHCFLHDRFGISFLLNARTA